MMPAVLPPLRPISAVAGMWFRSRWYDASGAAHGLDETFAHDRQRDAWAVAFVASRAADGVQISVLLEKSDAPC